MKRLSLLLLLLAATIIHAQKAESYANGNSLIKAMHTKYHNKWYKHFTFSQNMEFYRNDSIVKKDVWHETASLPGNLLIKFETKDAKNGVIFSNFKVHSFRDGQNPQSSPMVHDLLLIGLDVYFLDPEKTIHILDSLGYNLSKIREDEFEGRKVIVVGADKGDLESRQFWIDAERLYMHRVIYKQKNKTNEVIFADYYKTKNYWMAPTIIFKQNGKLNLIERYYDIKFPKFISEDFYKPEKFNTLVLE